MWDDITAIEFDLEEQYVEDDEIPRLETYNYYTNWISANVRDDENEAQHSYISDNGNLYIVIAENKNIKDFFDFDMINDAEYMDFKFSMYDVPDYEEDGDNDEEDWEDEEFND